MAEFGGVASEEPRLPIHGLVGGRLVPGVSRGRSFGVLDVWEERYVLPESEDEERPVRVHSQRRAIHGGSRAVGTPLTAGPSELVRYDAASQVVLSANEERFVELRERGDSEARHELARELSEIAEQLSEDDLAWRAVPITIDGDPVEAIELECEGWWVVLHVGRGKIADVWVCGPPGTRPDTLALETRGSAHDPDFGWPGASDNQRVRSRRASAGGGKRMDGGASVDATPTKET